MSASPHRPNVLVIIPHDLGTHLGCYGDDSVRSPNLDALAADGVRFANHFACAPYCSPSRGTLFTGRYPHTNGLMGLVNLGWTLPDGPETVAQSLGAAGYETYLFGMQHEAKDVARLGFHHVGDRSVGSSCVRVAPQVQQFLEERGQKPQEPFYARVGFSEVHRRYDGFSDKRADEVNVPTHLSDTPGVRRDLAMFHGAIERLDTAIGDILQSLDESGLRDNTFVVFVTDHGIAFPRAKATLYDPGIRTTIIMRWPDGLPSGRVVSEMVSGVDLLPTLHEATGTPVPAGVQGKSCLPLIRGEVPELHAAIFAEKNTSPDDVKRGVRTKRYKYIRNYDDGPLLRLPTDIETSLTRPDMGDDHLAPRPEVELYDLEADPNETENLAGREEASAAEQEMAGLLQRIMEETDDPILQGPIPRPPEEKEFFRRAWETAKKVASG